MAKILITGGTGFLGKRLAILFSGDGHEVVLGARNNKQNFLASQMTSCRALPMDVARMESVRDVFNEIRPDVVIHAAATKFVDLSEREPMECVDVNAVGMQNVARAAIDHRVRTVIGISTDKAAPPVMNTYGLTKSLMERTFAALDAKTPTEFLCVRYGNVAWSTGSVLTIWNRMHRETGVIGSTGPDMTRFFFTVEEAAQLVMTAYRKSSELRGKVLSREMKSARISDLLDCWTKHLGGRWERISGRPGERLDEYLVGTPELTNTCTVSIAGIRHYVISFNETAATPLKDAVSSSTAQRLSEPEMLALITRPPIEESA